MRWSDVSYSALVDKVAPSILTKDSSGNQLGRDARLADTSRSESMSSLEVFEDWVDDVGSLEWLVSLARSTQDVDRCAI